MTQNGIGAPDVTSAITTAHLVLIVLLAVAAMAVIWWGGRRRRERRSSRDEAEHRREQAPAIDEHHEQPAIAAEPAKPATLPAKDEVRPPEAIEHPEPVAPAPSPAAETNDGAADPTILKGLGPKLGARLAELGITRIDQLAALSPAEAAALDAELGPFKGRMERDRWIEQARLLSAGDRAGFEAQFGKLDR